MDSPCADRALLIEQYVAAVNAYGKAVNQKRKGSDLRTLRQLTLKTSELCEQTLKAVLEHEHRHGCANGARG